MNITTVIINFQTPELLTVAVNSFKTYYPKAPLLIIDNGSRDEGVSKTMIEKLSLDHEKVKSHFLGKNIYHGPAMDLAIKELVHSELTFFLDSDTETKQSGFLEEMEALCFSDDQIYGVGEITRSNKRGYKAENGEQILLTPYMLIRNDVYRSLKPFIHHGQPTLHNFIDSKKKGYSLKNFHVSEYINHLWRGTASRFGYGLGIRGKIDYILNKMGI